MIISRGLYQYCRDEVRFLLTSNASVCIDKDDEFVIPDFLLDAVARCMIKHDSHFLTDRFDNGGTGLEDFIEAMVKITFVPIKHSELADAAIELKSIIITRLRVEVQSYCDTNELEADVREVLKQNEVELTPLEAQFNTTLDSIIGVGGKNE
jgi:hypothetical protein